MELSNGFCEISQEEMLEMEGGCLVELAVGLAVVTVFSIASYDLYSCFKNAYNDVMVSASVSGGDAR